MKIKLIDLVLLIIILIIIVSFILLKIFTIKSEPILMEYARNKSTNIVNSIINKSLKDIMYSQYDIIKSEKNNNGDIISLNFDNDQINKILYYVNDNILEELNMLERNDYEGLNIKYFNNNKIYYIPLGIINSSPTLTNLGPKIPFKIEMLGNVNNDISNNVREYGINSSMIEVVLNIDVQLQVILPFQSDIVNVNKKIIIDSKIIQGTIPNYYGGFLPSTLK